MEKRRKTIAKPKKYYFLPFFLYVILTIIILNSRIYETDPSFESFMESIIKDRDLEYEQLKKMNQSKRSLWNLWAF